MLKGEESGSFDNATYQQVAPRVGLHPFNALKDIATFNIHRSRIPTKLFKSIVEDVDIMTLQYGPPPDHQTEEARSRFYSPIFNHLVTMFNFMLRNAPEKIKDCIGTVGRTQYFRTFGAVTILFVEMKFTGENNVERLKAIARVITESDKCNTNNKSQGHSLPIHCIFSGGWSFEFFKFERNANPSFTRGCFPGDPIYPQHGLNLQDFTAMNTSLPFILELRSVCETVFDVMLCGYIEGLKVSRRSEERRKKQDLKGPSLDSWDQAVHSAECALAAFRRAEDQRAGGDIESADPSVSQGLLALQESTGAVPTFYKSILVMKDWDDEEVGKT